MGLDSTSEMGMNMMATDCNHHCSQFTIKELKGKLKISSQKTEDPAMLHVSGRWELMGDLTVLISGGSKPSIFTQLEMETAPWAPASCFTSTGCDVHIGHPTTNDIQLTEGPSKQAAAP